MITAAWAPAVAGRFGLGAQPRLMGPVARGELGQVWRLTTLRGAYAVKEPFFDLDLDTCERDAAYQDLVRAAGVPMPAVVRSVAGLVVEPIDGVQLRVYSWVDVLPRGPSLDPASVGRVLAAIHRVLVPTGEPVEEWYSAPVGTDRWQQLVERLERAQAPFAGDLRRVLAGIAEVERLVQPTAAAAQICHRDLWADNLLTTPDGGLVVLDWENCGPGIPAQELFMVLTEHGARWRTDQQHRVRALLGAYEDAGGPARLAGPADATMLVAQIGHIGEEGCRRWLAAGSEDERRHNEAWVRELIDSPPTVALVQSILAANG